MVLVAVGPTKAPAEVTTPEPVVVKLPEVEMLILPERSEPEILLKEGAPEALPCRTVVVVPGRVDRAPPAALVTTPALVRAVSVTEANDAAPRPVTLHWASLKARSEPELWPMVIVPPVELPMVMVWFLPAVPISMEPLPAEEVPTSKEIFPAVPAEALPELRVKAPVEVVPVPEVAVTPPEAPDPLLADFKVSRELAAEEMVKAPESERVLAPKV